MTWKFSVQFVQCSVCSVVCLFRDRNDTVEKFFESMIGFTIESQFMNLATETAERPPMFAMIFFNTILTIIMKCMRVTFLIQCLA